MASTWKRKKKEKGVRDDRHKEARAYTLALHSGRHDGRLEESVHALVARNGRIERLLNGGVSKHVAIEQGRKVDRLCFMGCGAHLEISLDLVKSIRLDGGRVQSSRVAAVDAKEADRGLHSGRVRARLKR